MVNCKGHWDFSALGLIYIHDEASTERWGLSEYYGNGIVDGLTVVPKGNEQLLKKKQAEHTT